MSRSYLTSCVNANGDDIIAMQDAAEEIDFDEFIEEVGEANAASIVDAHGYEGLRKTDTEGLSLEGDWHVSYARSTYCGNEVVFMCHSHIEYIYV